MNQNQQIQSDSGECPVCHGTGWELYTATVVDYGLPEEITFAQRCSKCRGQFRGEDRTGTPKEYHDADLTEFNFNIYSHDMGKMQELCQTLLRMMQMETKREKILQKCQKNR